MPEPLVMTSKTRGTVTVTDLPVPGLPTIQIKQRSEIVCLDQTQAQLLMGWLAATLRQWGQKPEAVWRRITQEEENTCLETFERISQKLQTSP